MTACSRCGRGSVAPVCGNCARLFHAWERSFIATDVCKLCGCVRRRFRKRKKGDSGSNWKAEYNGNIGSAPKCI